MLNIEKSDMGFLHVVADGQLTTEDYVDFVTRFEWYAKGESSPISMLIELGPNFGGWSLDTLFRDHGFNLTQRRPLGQVAILAEERWRDWGAGEAYSGLTRETRFFEQSEKSKAEAWLGGQARKD